MVSECTSTTMTTSCTKKNMFALDRLRTQLAETDKEDEAVDYSVIHSLLENQFPGNSHVATTRIVKEAFRFSTTRRVTQNHRKIRQVVGVRLRFPVPSAPAILYPSVPSIQSTSGVTVGNLQLPLQQVAIPSVADHHTAQLLLQLQAERDRRLALEQQVVDLSSQVKQYEQVLPQYRNRLQSEIDAVALSTLSVLHGPDTEAHFHGFTMEGVVQDLKATCPQVYALVQEIARTQRNVPDDSSGDSCMLPLAELKGVMSMCTLLNARSNRVKGIQLLVSLMLVARATNKQVYWTGIHTCKGERN